jgi:dienelactone hydrolase
MDWFDLSFNRGDATQKSFPEEFIHRFDWAEWNRQQRPVDLAIPKKIETDSTRTEIMRCVQWSLGETPALPSTTPDTPFLTDAESKMMTHDRWGTKGITRIPVTFGNHVKGNVYAPADISQPAPVIIWLHPYSYHSGYNEGYGVKGTTIYHRLAKQGFVVLAFDQCGFGLRLLEGRDFYSKHPHWSRLGRMVHDVRSAVDFVIEGKGRAKSPLPPIDPSQVFVLGYAAGGTVAIYAAALDPRIRGVASFCGFTPLRTDTDEKTTGGIRRLWEWHALQPKLGLFHRREDQIPFDYHDILSLIAPRACLIVSPTRDRDATIEDVTAMMGLVKKRWATTGTEKNQLTHLAPDDVNRFQAEQHKIFSDWVQALLAEE